ncbi:MAG: helix-turn-helix transcriptional regulator [Chitinophagaceae bacterium]|nr:helix-turn-helix transcriptional regulator [Chitinophagaceae bacterium]
MNVKTMGELIKERREFLKLRQEDLGELSGVNLRTIHLIEKGRGNPSIETLNKLAAVLGLEVVLTIKQTN